jgi:hypothetical protein
MGLCLVPFLSTSAQLFLDVVQVEPGLAAGRNQSRLNPTVLNPARDRAAGDPEFSGQLAACD